MLENSLKWLALYTRSCWEKKVAGLLSKRGIENYCPLHKVQRHWSDRKKMIEQPLFTSYVFVHIPDNIHEMVRATPGVVNFVYWLGKPAVIRDEEITTIRQFLIDYENVQLKKTEVALKDHVKILSGPLESFEGDVVEIFSQTVKVNLPSLGYALVATVNKANVQKTNSTSSHAAIA